MSRVAVRSVSEKSNFAADAPKEDVRMEKLAHIKDGWTPVCLLLLLSVVKCLEKTRQETRNLHPGQ